MYLTNKSAQSLLNAASKSVWTSSNYRTTSFTFVVDFAEDYQLVHVGKESVRCQPNLFKLFRPNPAVRESRRFDQFLPPFRLLPHKHVMLQHQIGVWELPMRKITESKRQMKEPDGGRGITNICRSGLTTMSRHQKIVHPSDLEIEQTRELVHFKRKVFRCAIIRRLSRKTVQRRTLASFKLQERCYLLG